MHLNSFHDALRLTRGRRARGLAPLEFVMWLPIFLLVGALIVNLGTMQTWRLRGEIAARNAAWNARNTRQSALLERPLRPLSGVSNFTTFADPPAELDPPALRHPVIRGPLAEMEVLPLFDPRRLPVIVGHGRVQRSMPMLRSAGSFDSSGIRHTLLDQTWTMRQMGVASPLRNTRRRTLDLYIFPVGLPPAGLP